MSVWFLFGTVTFQCDSTSVKSCRRAFAVSGHQLKSHCRQLLERMCPSDQPIMSIRIMLMAAVLSQNITTLAGVKLTKLPEKTLAVGGAVEDLATRNYSSR